MLALRRANFDIIHVIDMGRAGLPDHEQLRFAAEQNRVCLTHDRADFEILHKTYMQRGWEHSGVVICTPHDVRTLTRLLGKLFEANSDFSNQIFHV